MLKYGLSQLVQYCAKLCHTIKLEMTIIDSNIINQDTQQMAAYFGIKAYCVYTTNLFFREIEVINEDNVPTEGPTIVYGNHNNQFVDGMLLCATIKREINFIAAAVSIRRRIIGDLLKISGAIPLERAQDLAVKGVGKIDKIQNGIIYGIGTKFTLIKPKSIFKIKKQEIRVDQIINDTEIKSTQADIAAIEPNSQYKVIPKLEYHELYHHVWAALDKGKCVGIFPQGGSHDRLELLPFKAGICIMALGAMEHHGCQVNLVPAGFNYYNPQNFRSKVILEFGPAYKVPMEMVQLYKTDKKKAISTLLEQLQKMLKQVTTTCLTFDEMSTLFLCRQLYARKSKKTLTPKEKIDLNRRFAKGFDQLVKEPKFKQTFDELSKFNEFIKLNGFSIKHNRKDPSRFVDTLKFLFYFEKCLLRLVISLPGIVLMGPTTTLIAYQAQKQRKRCLKNSQVKVRGNDVVGSYKILLSMIYFPVTAAIHTALLYFCLKKFSSFDQKKCLKLCALVPLLYPIYAMIFVKSYDSLGRSWKKLKFMFKRIFKREVYTEFEDRKKYLTNKIISLVDEYGDTVIEDFNANRIIKKEQMIASSATLLPK